MKPRWHARWRLLALAADAMTVTGALVAVAVARFGPDALSAGFVPAPGREFAQAPLLFAVPVWLGVFAVMRLYNPHRCQNGLQEARRLVTGGLAAAVVLVMLGFLAKENPARSWLFGGMVLGTLAAAVGRQTVRRVVGRLREEGRWLTPTVLVGRREAKRVLEALTVDRGSGNLPVATCGFSVEGLPSWEIGRVRAAVAETGASEIVVVAEDLERHEVGAALEVADELPVNVTVLPGLDHLLLHSLQLVAVAKEPALALEPPSVRSIQRTAKRALDLAGGALLLAVTAPLMAIASAAIRLESPGPVLFRQKREGMDGRVFELLKFRTMHEGVHEEIVPEEGPEDLRFLQKSEEDPRVTRVGRWLRRASLDELPQLWNVLRGEMSLVGPRPLPLWEGERLGLGRRLVVRPGMTGLWQVSGRSSLSPEERVRLDLVYVQNWTVLLDLSILLRTLPAVVGGRGAY